jgi:hypothetical protein
MIMQDRITSAYKDLPNFKGEDELASLPLMSIPKGFAGLNKILDRDDYQALLHLMQQANLEGEDLKKLNELKQKLALRSKINLNTIMTIVFGSAEMAGMGGIFGLMFANAFTPTKKLVLFPLISLIVLTVMALTWRDSMLEKHKNKGKLISALIHTATALLITLTVAGTLAASALALVAGPFVFIAATAIHVLRNIATGIKSVMAGKKAAKEGNANAQAASYSQAKVHFVSAGIGALFGALISSVMVFLHIKTSILAVPLAAGAVAFSAYQGLKVYQNKKMVDAAIETIEEAEKAAEAMANTKIANDIKHGLSHDLVTIQEQGQQVKVEVETTAYDAQQKPLESQGFFHHPRVVDHNAEPIVQEIPALVSLFKRT